MKNLVFTIIFLLSISLYPVYSSFADMPNASTYASVRYTVHNLSYDIAGLYGLNHSERNYTPTNPDVTEVCVFCHTPHNSSQAIPLWNRPALDQPAASAYRLYTSSASLSTTVKNAALTATSESLLCLSCHDGKTAMNVLHNTRVSDATNGDGNKIIDFWGDNSEVSFGFYNEAIAGAYPSNLGAIRGTMGEIVDGYAGTNLTDDHPIGFSYESVLNEPGKASSLHTLAEAKASKLRFYGPNRDRVECSSCHNPHVYYGYGLNGPTRVPLDRIGSTAAQRERAPFLVVGNNGSALCLGCHIK